MSSQTSTVLLEDKIVSFLQKNQKVVVSVFLLVLGAFAFIYWNQYQKEQSERKAFEEVYFIQKTYEAHIEKAFKASPPTSRQRLKAFQPYLEQLESFFHKHTDKTATWKGVLDAAFLLREHGEPKKPLNLS